MMGWFGCDDMIMEQNPTEGCVQHKTLSEQQNKSKQKREIKERNDE